MRSALCMWVVALSVGCAEKPSGGLPSPADHGSKSAEKKVYLRDEFRSLVMGKTTDEVLAAVGKPDRTQDSGSTFFWQYNNLAKDPITGEIDSTTQVTFEDGKVISVDY